MRLVLDTNVVISGLLWHGSPERLVRLARANSIHLYTSTPLLVELMGILSRHKFARKIAATLLNPDQLVESYVELATLVQPTPVARLAPDPDDDVVIGTAIAARADLIVTGDQDLLSVKRYDGGRILSVIEALEAISPA